MKISKYFVLISLSVFLFSCAKTPLYQSSWQSSEESLSENNIISVEKLNYDKKAKMAYSISNNDSHLFINLKIVDQITQQKIVAAGLTLWIDTLGNKREQLGIVYPQAIPNFKLSGSVKSNQPNQTSEAILVGFSEAQLGVLVGSTSPDNIHVSCSVDSLQIMYYHARIPLEMIISNTSEFLSDTTNVLSVGFESGTIEMPVAASSGGRGGGRGGSKGGGGRGGGKGGRSSASSTSSSQGDMKMQEFAQSSKFWVKKVHLSSHHE